MEEKKPDKPDSMQDMMERIRSGNVQLKKVQGNPAPKPSGGGSGDVMSEMAKLLVSIRTRRVHNVILASMFLRLLEVGKRGHLFKSQRRNNHRAIRCQMSSL